MRVSRVQRAACPVNINLSAQWSYHEGRLGRNFDVTDGGGALSYLEQCPTKTAVCNAATRVSFLRPPAPSLPFPSVPPLEAQEERTKVRYWRRKRKNNDIISNHHARWVDPRPRLRCCAVRRDRRVATDLTTCARARARVNRRAAPLRFRYCRWSPARTAVFRPSWWWSSPRPATRWFDIRAAQRPRGETIVHGAFVAACRKLLNYSERGRESELDYREGALRRCYSARNA